MVANCTDQPLQVYLQYYTLNDQNMWKWYPADPGKSDKAQMFDLPPDSLMKLNDHNYVINAQKVRIWAETKSKGVRYEKYRYKDYDLIPKGRNYIAQEMMVTTIKFGR